MVTVSMAGEGGVVVVGSGAIEVLVSFLPFLHLYPPGPLPWFPLPCQWPFPPRPKVILDGFGFGVFGPLL